MSEHVNEIARNQSNDVRIRIRCNLSIIALFNNMSLVKNLQSLKQELAWMRELVNGMKCFVKYFSRRFSNLRIALNSLLKTEQTQESFNDNISALLLDFWQVVEARTRVD